MNKQESISSFQMAMLFLAGMTGSSIVLIPSPLAGAAKNGAWLSLIIAFAMGLLILACILYLHRANPGAAFFEQSRQALGKWLTILLAVPYVCALFWQVSAIVIEIGGFFKSTMMKETPVSAIHILFFVTIALTVRQGIEVIARMAVVLLTLMFAFILMIWAMASPYYHAEFLLPFMPDGIKPILHGAYIAYGFPYAEVALYAMILPYVRNDEKPKLGKMMTIAITVNGITLLVSIICSIMALGPLAGELKYSLYQLARLIFIQEIIERIESVVGFSLIVGSYMKASIVLFILIKVLAQLLKLPDSNMLVFPVALVCLLLASTMYAEELKFTEDGYIIWPLMDTAAYIAPLLLVALVTWLRRKKQHSREPVR